MCPKFLEVCPRPSKGRCQNILMGGFLQIWGGRFDFTEFRYEPKLGGLGERVWFVFVVLLLCSLLTAGLNNNNKDFDRVSGWWWWVRTHNVVKPTSTWLWLSWVLTKKHSLHYNEILLYQEWIRYLNVTACTNENNACNLVLH